MAGIYDRLIPGEDRLPIHFVKAAVYFQVSGIFTQQQILNALNSMVAVPLSAAAEIDLQNICTQAGSGTATARLDYLERLDSLNLGAENNLIPETTYRTRLSIP